MIRNLKIEDADTMLEWMHDDNVTKYLKADFAKLDKERVINFINDFKDADIKKGELHYAICDKENSYIGTVSLKNIDMENKNAEYAIVTCSKAHGKGYAKQATFEILKIAFEKLGLEKVYLYAATDNTPANAFYTKMNFPKEGCFRKHLMIKGKLRDVNWYGILAEDYNRIKDTE